jgi:hypothetical protein
MALRVKCRWTTVISFFRWLHISVWGKKEKGVDFAPSPKVTYRYSWRQYHQTTHLQMRSCRWDSRNTVVLDPVAPERHHIVQKVRTSERATIWRQ